MIMKTYIANKEGVPLAEHLKMVGDLSYHYASNLYLDNVAKEIARYIGYTHDIGKYTSYFQDKIRDVRDTLYSRHSLISSMLASTVYSEYYGDLGGEPYISHYIAIPIAYHHSGLGSIGDLKNRYITENNMGIIDRQLNDQRKYRVEIRDDLSKYDLAELGDAIYRFLGKYENDEIKKKFRRIIASIYVGRLDGNTRIKLFHMTRLLFSLLIDSDKKISSDVDLEAVNGRITSDHVLKYIEGLANNGKSINRLRYRLYNLVLTRLSREIELIAENDIIVLNAPTGAGKTLLGILTATKLREYLESRDGVRYRVIYALPYINIIEQTYEVLGDILGSIDYRTLLKYHHLSLDGTNNEDIPLENRLLIIDSWDSDFIVTTFNQILEAYLSNVNRRLKKLHNIANSIIIMDEIQTLPAEYWLLFRELVLQTSKYLNIKYIFMTATLPTIFDGVDAKIYDLISRSDVRDTVGWNIKRWILHLDKVFEDPTDLANYIIDRFDDIDSLLIVTNTIKRSKEVYRIIKEIFTENRYRINELVDKDSTPREDYINMTYLSTNVVPRDRLYRVYKVDESLKSGYKTVVVSTQVVEAGVDLDFHVVVRDIAPFDSVIQVAGRCNRNFFRRDCGAIYLTRYGEENGLDSRRIYGKLSIDITEEILNNMKELLNSEAIYESNVIEYMDRYYRDIINRRNIFRMDSSLKILNEIREVDFDGDSIRVFSLYPEPLTASVVIELDDNVRSILDSIEDYISMFRDARDRDLRDIMRIRANIRALMIKLNEYIVSDYPERIPLNNYERIETLGRLFLIPNKYLDRYYDSILGLKHIDEYTPRDIIID